jgi:phosphatidylserine/phosphatidylglycerophosphate/cardiolipin synthase-like enzyme
LPDGGSLIVYDAIIDDDRREKTRNDNRCFDSRHETMSLVDGAPAAAMGELFRERWTRATGETVPACPPVRRPRWPGKICSCPRTRAAARPVHFFCPVCIGWPTIRPNGAPGCWF